MSETNGTESCEVKAAECEHIAAKMPDGPSHRIYLDLAAKWREGAPQFTAPKLDWLRDCRDRTGFIVDNEAEAMSAIGKLPTLDRARVRAAFERRLRRTSEATTGHTGHWEQ